MLIQEQDEVIDMLERLRDRKRFVAFPVARCSHYPFKTREQLSHFSDRVLSSALIVTNEHKMEIDSMASTPYVPS